MNKEAQIFRLLGDENRLRMIVLLIDRQLCVGHIQAGLDLEQSNTSKQLTLLRNANIVSLEKQKQRNYYYINCDFLKEHKDLINVIRTFKKSELYKEDEKRMIDIHNCGCEEGCLCKL